MSPFELPCLRQDRILHRDACPMRFASACLPPTVSESALRRPPHGSVERRFSSRNLPRFATAAGLAVAAVIWTDAPHQLNAQSTACGGGIVNTYHPAQCDASGNLIPWLIDAAGPFHSIMGLEASWWVNAPLVSGWPTYLTAAKLTRNYSPAGDAIPASTAAMAIEAYLK